MMTFVYVQIPPELALTIAAVEQSLTPGTATLTGYRRLLGDGYDDATDTQYSAFELDEGLAKSICWLADTSLALTPNVAAEFINYTAPANPLQKALFGTQNLTTNIDTGYGGPRYTPPEGIELVAAALRQLDHSAMTARAEELIRLGRFNKDYRPFIEEGLHSLAQFYAQALQTGHGVVVTPV